MTHRFPKTLLILLIFAAAATAGAVPDDEANYRAAEEYSRRHNGIAMLVVKGEDIVFERYSGLGGRDTPWMLASGTKSFSGVMCAAAIDDGLISGFDEKVSDTITEWRADARRAKVTIRQLLSLTSGVEAGELGLTVPLYIEAIERPARHEPGTFFEYGPVPFQVFGELMTRKLRPKKESVEGYLKRRILDPLGMSVGLWRKDAGQPLLPQGAMLTAREWAKFGQMLRDRGRWKGKQLISAANLAELTKGSKANPAYGITFWLNANGSGPAGDDRPSIAGNTLGVGLGRAADIYMAAGAGNQRLYVIPSQSLVVVRYGIFGGFDDREFISRLIGPPAMTKGQ